MKKANLYGLALLPPVAFMAALYLLVWGFEPLRAMVTPAGLLEWGLTWLVAAPAAFVAGIAAHELLHGLSFICIGGAPRESVTLIGFQSETATPYSACSRPLRARAYRWAIAMPGLVLGILPAAAGVVTGNPWAMLFGLIFILSASGDAIILWLLRKVPPDAMVEDHPYRAGCYAHLPVA